MEGAGDGFAEFGAGHADELGGGPGGVQERSQKIENRALALFGAKLAGGGDVFEGRMIVRREEKAEVVFAQCGGGFGGRKIGADAQGFEDVGAAGLGGDGAVAVLGDGDTRGGQDEGDGGGDVEGVELIAAGSADVNDYSSAGFLVEGQGDGMVAEFAGEGVNFLDGFAFARQGR